VPGDRVFYELGERPIIVEDDAIDYDDMIKGAEPLYRHVGGTIIIRQRVPLSNELKAAESTPLEFP
jgi:hypothetical protein